MATTRTCDKCHDAILSSLNGKVSITDNPNGYTMRQIAQIDLCQRCMPVFEQTIKAWLISPRAE